eukprot:scaffold6580_cov101-Isochrysis_galbana.AAC.1
MKSTDRLGVSEGSMRMSQPYVLSSRPAPSSYEYVYRLGSLDDVTTAHAAMQRPVTSSAHRECQVRIMTMAPGLGPHGTARPVSVFRNWCRGVRLPLEALCPGSSGSPCAAVARPSAADTVPAAGCVGWPVLGPRSISAKDAEGAPAAAATRRRSSAGTGPRRCVSCQPQCRRSILGSSHGSRPVAGRGREAQQAARGRSWRRSHGGSAIRDGLGALLPSCFPGDERVQHRWRSAEGICK